MGNISFDFLDTWPELFGLRGAIAGGVLAIILILLTGKFIKPFGQKAGTAIFVALCLAFISIFFFEIPSGGGGGSGSGDEQSTTVSWGPPRGGLKILPEGLTKRGGSAWDADILSKNFIPAGSAGKVTHKINCTTAIYGFGLTASNSSTAFEDMGYSFLLAQKGGTQLVAQLATNLGTDFKTLEVSHEISIEKTKDGSIIYSATGKAPYTATVGEQNDLMLEISIYNAGCPISGFRLEGDWQVKK